MPVALATREDVTPTIAQVAALLHARTYSGGEEQGTFDETTSPTGAQVAVLVETAIDDVASRIVIPIPLVRAGEARRLAALQAASMVEASFLPNELEGDRTAYRQYQAMFLNGIDALIRALCRPGVE